MARYTDTYILYTYVIDMDDLCYGYFFDMVFSSLKP